VTVPLSGTVTMFTDAPTLDHPVTDQELVKALEQTLCHLQTSYDMVCVPAVYRSPAQVLRDSADALEKKDRDIQEARLILNTYKKHNKGKENE
jgi:hypothetical protein